MVLRFNGTTWTPVQSRTTEALRALWGSGPNEVWAAGYTGTLLRWDGSSFSRMASGTAAVFTSLWGRGPGDLWVCGSGGAILHRRP